jgi:hypothetical protein
VIIAIGLWVIRRFVDLSILWRLSRAVLATGGMTTVCWFASRLGLVQVVAAGLVSFTLLAILLRVLSREELAGLRRIAERVPRRARLGQRRED